VNGNGAGAKDVQGDLLIVIERKCFRSCLEFNIGQQSVGMYGRRPHYEAVANNRGASYAARRSRVEQGYSVSTTWTQP
jgi:hypothetical protein